MIAVRARNLSVNAENGIHADEGARALGFARGLVSGVTLYSYMTRLLVARRGAAAMEGTSSRVAFFAPVHDGDALEIAVDSAEPDAWAGPVSIRAAKAHGEAVAIWEVERPRRLTAPDPPPALQPRGSHEERPAFRWEAVASGQPFHGFVWRPDGKENRAWCDSVEDELELYRTGMRPLCHPGWVLQQANQAIAREFRMPPWIHVSSRIACYRAPRVGDTVEVSAVPLETWERQGNRYALLRVAMTIAGQAALEIGHKTILQLAPPGSPC
jgi:hypothetical protein